MKYAEAFKDFLLRDHSPLRDGLSSKGMWRGSCGTLMFSNPKAPCAERPPKSVHRLRPGESLDRGAECRLRGPDSLPLGHSRAGPATLNSPSVKPPCHSILGESDSDGRMAESPGTLSRLLRVERRHGYFYNPIPTSTSRFLDSVAPTFYVSNTALMCVAWRTACCSSACQR
jgi:hypothetical protein